jgi:hypothetical protein
MIIFDSGLPLLCPCFIRDDTEMQFELVRFLQLHSPVAQEDIDIVLSSVFESVVLVTTLYHTWVLVREQVKLNARGTGGIVEAVLRNGALLL